MTGGSWAPVSTFLLNPSSESSFLGPGTALVLFPKFVGCFSLQTDHGFGHRIKAEDCYTLHLSSGIQFLWNLTSFTCFWHTFTRIWLKSSSTWLTSAFPTLPDSAGKLVSGRGNAVGLLFLAKESRVCCLTSQGTKQGSRFFSRSLC